MEKNKHIKQSLLQKCHAYVEFRISNARKALEEAQRAANEETKSSAGDKYNTERAMMQIERDKHAVQLAEAQKLKRALDSINADKNNEVVQLGSLVETNEGNFFLAISMGKVEVEEKSFLIISPGTPIGQALFDKKVGALAVFNNKTIHIQHIS